MRRPYRLLVALLLFPAAVGIAGTGFRAPRTDYAIVDVRGGERRAPRPVVAEELQPVLPALPVYQRPPRFAWRPTELFFHHWLYQRPPPALLFFHS